MNFELTSLVFLVHYNQAEERSHVRYKGGGGGGGGRERKNRLGDVLPSDSG